jgi:hypothetical protein
MRIFSKKELAYLEKLKERNAQLIRGKDLTEASERELFYQPLSNPMAVNERKIRQRIREKAVMAIADLVLAGCAGVVPDKKLRKQGVRDVSGIFDEVRTYMLLQMVCGEREKVGENEVSE